MCFRRTAGSVEDDIRVYADASFADDLLTRRSTTGMIITLGNTAIRWKSIKQKHVTASTFEAEIESLEMSLNEVIWFKALLLEVKLIRTEFVFPVYEDNRSAIAFLEGSGSRPASKHISVRYHRLREEIQAGTMKLHYISTKEQLADILTKNERGDTILRCVKKIMGMDF
jgi:hypothetical protein